MNKNNKNKKYVIGIDIGGTTSKIGIFTSEMEIIKKWKINTDIKNNGKNIIKNSILSIFEELLKNNIDKKDVKSIGVVVPGPVLNETVVNKAVNIGWKKPYNIKKEVEKYFYKGINIKVANDANAAAFGEYNIRNNKNINTLVLVTIGTGIGGGLVINGKIHNGKNGCAMEIGHIKVKDDGKICNCGGNGCIETICGTNNIKENFIIFLKDKKLKNLKSEFRKYKKNELVKLDTKDICDYAKKKDELCLYTIRYVMINLGKMLANIILTLDPDIIVLGGGISKTGNLIIKYIKEGIKNNMFMVKNFPPIEISKLSEDAGIYGAGYLVK